MTLLYTLDLIGTAAFAASGAWAGVRREMDLFGVVVLGLVTAIGGGTLRDILLGSVPPFALQDESYLYLSIIVSLLVFVCHRQLQVLQHPLLIFDAIGLGTFVVIGTSKALEFGTGILGAVILGTMTATAGGVIRDLLSGRVPLILQREIYASACLAGSILLALLLQAPLPAWLPALLAALAVIGIRLLAIKRRWNLPKAE
ncbi:MAG TPA: trimeric intracellular cation channel family protein [Geothermobacteraceae bacterium]|nr:trimeric intracellular cation channel family protein [Geothermobacteraceae bacterium]